MEILTFEEARNTALKYVGYAARSEAEIAQRLRKCHAPDVIIEAVLADFRDHGWIDDAEFARKWVADRANRKLYGKIRLAQELQQRGLNRDYVEAALAIDDEDAEIARAQAALASKTKNLSHNSEDGKYTQQEKQKLSGFLQRRGFSFNIITKVLKQDMEN